MNWSPKIVTVLCFFQAFFIVAGCLIVRSMFRFIENDDEFMGYHVHINVLVQFVRSYGLWCLLITIAWCISATLIHGDADGGWVSIPSIQIGVGVALTIFIAVFYSIAVIQAIAIAF
jgi:hypothetical protein